MENLARIFISYSRQETDTAMEIRARLVELGHEVHIDQSGILPLEDIRARISDMIHDSDVVLLLLSRNWLNSRNCRWEFQYASGLNKKFVPIALQDVGPDLPPEITRIHYIPYYGGTPFETVIDKARTAFETNLVWVRAHSRYESLALHWNSQGGMTLRGKELKEAINWLRNPPRKNAPEPTETQKMFIRASRVRRICERTIYTLVALAITISAGAVLYVNQISAREEKRQEQIAQWKTAAEQALANAQRSPETAIRQSLSVWLRAQSDPNFIPNEVYEAIARAIPNQRMRALIETGPYPIQAVHFSTAGDRIFVRTGDQEDHVFDAVTGAPATRSAVTEAPNAGPAELRIQDNQLQMWHPDSGTITPSPIVLPPDYSAVALSEDGEIAAIGQSDGNIAFLTFSTGKPAFDPIEKLENEIKDLSFIDGKYAVIAAEGQRVHFLDAETGRALSKPIELEGSDPITAMSLSSDHRHVAVAAQNMLGVWERGPTAPIPRMPMVDFYNDKKSFISALDFNANGDYLLIAGNDKRDRFHLMEMRSQTAIFSERWTNDPITFASFSTESNQIILGTQNGRIRLYDADLGVATTVHVPNIQRVLDNSDAVDNALNGELLFEQSSGSVTLDPSHIANLSRPDHPGGYNSILEHDGYSVTALAVSPDERFLITAAVNGIARVWDTHTGYSIFEFQHPAPVGSQAHPRLYADFSPDGQSVITWWRDEDVRLWNISLPGENIMQAACHLLPFKNGRRAPITAASQAVGEPTDDSAPCDRFTMPFIPAG